ncbi:MAG: hypothetical protein ACLFPI_12345 [Desulfobacterales bacterium]
MITGSAEIVRENSAGVRSSAKNEAITRASPIDTGFDPKAGPFAS